MFHSEPQHSRASKRLQYSEGFRLSSLKQGLTSSNDAPVPLPLCNLQVLTSQRYSERADVYRWKPFAANCTCQLVSMSSASCMCQPLAFMRSCTLCIQLACLQVNLLLDLLLSLSDSLPACLPCLAQPGVCVTLRSFGMVSVAAG